LTARSSPNCGADGSTLAATRNAANCSADASKPLFKRDLNYEQF